MSSCRAMVVTSPGKMEPREFPLPQIGDDDGLIKVELVGVCGSDPGIFKGKATRIERPYPLIMGHEIVGRVVEMGAAARRRRGLDIGDRVIVEYAFGCGQCRSCLSGRYYTCEEYYTYGNLIGCTEPPHLFGGYSEYLYVHPRAMVHKIGDEISPEVGVLICAVLGNAVRWLRQVGGVALKQPAVIIGPGQQGLAGVIVAKESGAEPIIVVGLKADAERLELAKRMGADVVVMADEEDPVEAVAKATGGLMGAVVLEVCGHPSGAPSAISLAGHGGTVVLPGLYGAATEVPLKLDQAIFKELTIKGVYSHNFLAVEPAIKIARSGKYPLEELISHRFPLEKAEEAVRLVAGEKPEENPIKVVIDPTA